MLGYGAECLRLHLNQMTPTVSHCYIHVNIAKAVAVSIELVMFEQPEKEDFCRTNKAEPYRDGFLALMR